MDVSRPSILGALRTGVAVTAMLATACAIPSEGERAAARLAGQAQSRSLTCESRSAADLLAFHGIAANEVDVFGRIPRSDNPDRGFVGDPDGPPGRLPPEGYGVHAGPVAAALQSFGLDVRDASGQSFEWLKAETHAGRPVIVWITGSCDPSSRSSMVDAQGRSFTAVRGEHTVLVVSADGAGVTVVDPAGGLRRRFERVEFEAAWELFGRMAIGARGPRPTVAGSSK